MRGKDDEAGEDQAADDARRMGVPEGEIDARYGNGIDDDQPGDFEVWEENFSTLEVFLSLSTQWRPGPLGGCLGLDYPGVRAALRMRRVRKPQQVFADLQVMESAALKVLNRKKADQS